MTIPLSEINKAINAVYAFLEKEAQGHKSFLNICSEDMTTDEIIKSEQDHNNWFADMKQEIANLKTIQEVWERYREHEDEKVSAYKKRLWLQFYEELSEDMKEKIDIDQAIDFEYP